MNNNPRKCPECGGISLYTTTVGSAGGQGPSFLRGLGGFLRTAKFNIIVCATCGLTRFFAEKRAREKLSRSDRWRQV